MTEDYSKYPWQNAEWDLLPEHMRGGMLRYVVHGIRPGSFLEAVLANDLMRACECADIVNKNALHNYAQFMYNYVPGIAKGSWERVNAWCEQGGMGGC